MTGRNLLLLSIINHYKHSNGFCYVTNSDIAKFCSCGYSPICKDIKTLVELGYIERHTKNGFKPKYKIINNEYDFCMLDFIYSDINVYSKQYLCKLYYSFENYDDLTVFSISKKTNIEKDVIYRANHRLKGLKNIKNILLNCKRVNELTDEDVLNTSLMVKDDQMLFYCTTKKCKKCNKEFFSRDKEEFFCKDCAKGFRKTLDSNDYIIASRLNQLVKASAYMRRLEKDLNVSDIVSLLKKQNYKCYYTGESLLNDELTDKDKPSIDRLDSSIGYLRGNVVICKAWANIMKNDSSNELFKERIKLLSNNINNF